MAEEKEKNNPFIGIAVGVFVFFYNIVRFIDNMLERFLSYVFGSPVYVPNWISFIIFIILAVLFIMLLITTVSFVWNLIKSWSSTSIAQENDSYGETSVYYYENNQGKIVPFKNISSERRYHS